MNELKMEGTQPITEEHLKIMAQRLTEAMNGLWAIIEDHGTAEMKRLRDGHLGACGIVMNIGDECGNCPACQARAEGIIGKKPAKREGHEFVAEIVGDGPPPTKEELEKLMNHGAEGKLDA